MKQDRYRNVHGIPSCNACSNLTTSRVFGQIGGMPTSFLFQSGQAHLVSKLTLFGGLWDCSVSTAKNANFGSSRAIEFLFPSTIHFM